MHRAHKIKLIPTKAQAVYFAKACGTPRHACNWALAQWRAEYEAGGKPSEGSLRKKLNAIKATEFPWYSEVTKCAPQQAIKNLGTAFQHFFRRVQQGGKPGYPKFKRKGVRDSFRADNGPQTKGADAVKVSGKRVTLPRCGAVKMREQLRFCGQILSATISRLADGWYVTLLVDTQDRLISQTNNGTVGVDLGVKALAVLSTGEVIPSLKPHRAAHKRLVRLSRSLSRKHKGSANRAKAKARLARLHQRIANVREDALHKRSTRLVTEFDTVAIEDLNVSAMLRNQHLARSIADSGFAEFRRQLEYKAWMTGAHVYVADRFFPSRKTCSACGTINDMTLADRTYRCGCANVIDRDLNAAINLQNLAASYAVTACGEDGSGHDLSVMAKPASMKQEAKCPHFA